MILGRALLKGACAATNRYARSDQFVGERPPGAITLTSHCAPFHQDPVHELNPGRVVLFCYSSSPRWSKLLLIYCMSPNVMTIAPGHAYVKCPYIANICQSSVYPHTHRQAQYVRVRMPVRPHGLNSRLSPSFSSMTLFTSTIPTSLSRFSQPPNGLATPRTAAAAARCGTGMWIETHSVSSPVNECVRAGGSCGAEERSTSTSSLGSGSSPRSILACLQMSKD